MGQEVVIYPAFTHIELYYQDSSVIDQVSSFFIGLGLGFNAPLGCTDFFDWAAPTLNTAGSGRDNLQGKIIPGFYPLQL
jgi:hypothetical protein